MFYISTAVMFSITILLISLATSFMGRVTAGPLAVRGYPMHPIGDFTWRGNITENGPVMEYTGKTFGHIEQQIVAHVPGFTFNATWFAQSYNSTGNGIGVENVMGKPQCGIIGGHRPCERRIIIQGAEYLESKGGLCGIEGKTCSRISCSYDAGIYWCNDNDAKVQTPCKSLGYNARNVGEKCIDIEGMGAKGVAGQIFNSAGWNNFVGATTAEEGGC